MRWIWNYTSIWVFCCFILCSGGIPQRRGFASECCKFSANTTLSALNCLEEHLATSLSWTNLQNGKCNKSQSDKRNSSAARMLFISYYTHHIRNHALYAYALNSIYATQFCSSLHMLSPSTGHDFDKHDQRWNKVMIIEKYLLKFLSTLEESDNNSPHYLVWLDADLIIVDHKLDFYNDLAKKYPHRDIIISREINPMNGVANSGCFIVKVSAWSLRFFQTWWRIRDRTEGMDQHVFDYIYYHDPNGLDCQNHIELLDVDAINSKFPGLINYEDHQPIFHLAGESNFIREHIFKLSWESLCGGILAENQYISLERYSFELFYDVRLNISRKFLDNIDYIALHEQEWQSIHQDVLLATDQFSNISTDYRYEAQSQVEDILNGLRYRVREAQQSINKFVCRHQSLTTSLDSQYVRESDNFNHISSDEVECVDIQSLFEETIAQVLTSLFSLADRLLGPQTVSANDYEENIESNPSTGEPSIPYKALSHLDNWISGLQLVVDTGMELLLVEKDPTRFLSVALTLRHRVMLLKKLIPERLEKFVLYYEFKVQEFIALYYERMMLIEWNSSIPSEVDSTAYYGMMEHLNAFRIWKKMHETHDFQGTGNGILTTYQEAILLLKKILWFFNIKYFSTQLSDLAGGIVQISKNSFCRKQIDDEVIIEIVEDLKRYIEKDVRLRVGQITDEQLPMTLLALAQNGFHNVTNDLMVQLFDCSLLLIPLQSCHSVMKLEDYEFYQYLFCFIVSFEESDCLDRRQRELWRERCSTMKRLLWVDNAHMLSTNNLYYPRLLPISETNDEKKIQFIFNSFIVFFPGGISDDGDIMVPRQNNKITRTKKLRKKRK